MAKSHMLAAQCRLGIAPVRASATPGRSAWCAPGAFA
jgi:hypothetical protein